MCIRDRYLPKERQTIMFSATMPSKIQQLANTILNNPAAVSYTHLASIIYNDPALGIDWPIADSQLVMSEMCIRDSLYSP